MSAYDAFTSGWWQLDVSTCSHIWEHDRCALCGCARLYPFQVEGATFLDDHNGRGGLFHEMGLGKTIMALAWIWRHPEARVAVISKAGLKYQLASEVKRWLGIDAQIIEGSYDALDPESRIYIMSYGLLVPVKRYVRGVPSFSGFNLDKFESARVNTIVLDECQAIANVTSKTSKAVRRLAARCGEHLIALSGTPWKNRGGELWPICHLLDPNRFPSYQYFLDTEVEYFWDGGYQKMGGLANPQAFKAKTAHIFLRRNRAEVMPQLPPVTRTQLACELTPAEWDDYHTAEDAFADAWSAITGQGVKEDRERQAKLMALRHEVGRLKVRAAAEFAEDFLDSTDRKLVLFVQHLDVGDKLYGMLRTWCAAHRYPQPVRYLASLSPAARDEVVRTFNTSARVMVCSTLAGGEGLNLQTCSDAVMVERQWNPANEEQPESRFVRIGQTAAAVVMTYPSVPRTVDEYSDRLIEGKRHAFKAWAGDTPDSWHEAEMTRVAGDLVMANWRQRHERTAAAAADHPDRSAGGRAEHVHGDDGDRGRDAPRRLV